MAAKMKGMTPTVDPASPAHRREAHTSIRSSFARYEVGRCRIRSVSDICGLKVGEQVAPHQGVRFVQPILNAKTRPIDFLLMDQIYIDSAKFQRTVFALDSHMTG